MSILRKIPKIEQVLDNMSLESLKRLESLMNSGNGATETYTLFGGENKLNYENKDLGVWYCNIELERNKSVETGFLIWESETKALFVSFDITQCLKEYEIDLTNYTFVLINEKLSIEEFRRVLEDNINKEVVHIDTSGNVEVGKNLVVDGKVILNGKEDLVDTSGNELISGGGQAMFDINPYTDFETMIMTEEGYNLLYDGLRSGKYAGIISGNINAYPICIDDFYPLRFQFTNFEPSSPNDIYKTLIIDKNTKQITIEEDNIYVYSSFYTKPSFEPTTNTIPCSTPSGQQNLTVGDGLEIKNGALKTKEVESTEFICANYGFELQGISEGPVGQGVDVGKGVVTSNIDVVNKATQFINLFSNKESFSKHKCSISIEIDSLGIYTEVTNLYPVKQGDSFDLFATLYLFGNAYANIFKDSLNRFSIQFIYIEPTESKLTQLAQIMTALATSGKITFNILEL